MNLEEGIIDIISKQVEAKEIQLKGIPFSECQKTYWWTNENVGATLDLEDTSDKEKALCVCSSGDHTFNLICNGVLNIDTFDTNRFTEYLAFGIKKAIILKYDYNDFFMIMEKITDKFTSLEELTCILMDLLPFMESDYRIFWEKIISTNYKLQKENNTNLNLIELVSMGISTSYKGRNNYLRSEEDYNRLKKNLGASSITFKNVNARYLEQYYEGNKYDIIMLSNILDYFDREWKVFWDYSFLDKYINSLYNISNNDALIYLKYVIGYAYKNSKYRNELFATSRVKAENFASDEIQLVPKSDYEPDLYDGVILKRAK